LQNEHLRLNSALVQRRLNGDSFVTKKRLEQEYPRSKEFLRQFTQEHPEILQQFKEETKEHSLTNLEIADIEIRIAIENLVDQLNNLPPGTDAASDYHKLVKGILELIFYPHLINPIKEREIHEGRKRIDITFDNAATEGIFKRLSENMNIPSAYVFVECKNYSSDPANPELDQLAGRFSTNRGKFGLLFRTIDNLPLFISRCIDTYADGRGLIVPIIDTDLITLLNNYNNWDSAYLETFLSNRIREIAIN